MSFVFLSGMGFAKAWIGALLPLVVACAAANPEPGLAWRSWSPEVFARAKREHKFVLLDLEAVWCHWCHVMDDITYRDPAVRKELNAHYLLVKVDQDARPDISNCYEDYGWPAAVVFNGDGQEIVKRQGYMPPKPMLSILCRASMRESISSWTMRRGGARGFHAWIRMSTRGRTAG